MRTIDFAELRRLALFANVVDQGSFAAAATKLGLSRSSVSEQIALLEQALEVRLLQRTTRRLSLTPEGKQVYKHAAAIARAATQVKDAVAQEIPKGTVRITTTHELGIQWLGPRLAAFTERYPLINLDIRLSDEVLDLVSEEIDLALRLGIPRDSSLISRTIRRERPQVMASPEYLSRHGTPENLEQLKEHRWVILQRSSPTAAITLTNGKERRVIRPAHCHYTDAPHMVRLLIENGVGIGIHLPSMLEDDLKKGTLKTLLPKWSAPTLQFALVYPSRRQVPLRTRVLIDYLIEDPSGL